MINIDEFLKFIFEREDYWNNQYKPTLTEHMIHDVREKYGEQGVSMYNDYVHADPNDLGNDECPECTEKAKALSDRLQAELDILSFASNTTLDKMCDDFYHLFVTGDIIEFDLIVDFMKSKDMDTTELSVKQFKMKLFLKYLQQ